jgi:transposase InsO family protein
MCRANPLWGAPRVHGELVKRAISISQAAVSKYMIRRRKPPSQTWRSFLDNHVEDLVSIDFFTLPTATFRILFVFIILRHDRRRIVHFNITEHPSAEWTAQQIVDAFPWDTAPRYMLRDRDGIYGPYFKRRVAGLDIEQVPTAPRSPWQSPYVERVIGSIRRECLDHVIFLDERHLRRILREYVDYYHSCRTHLSLEKDAPEQRPVQWPSMGRVTAIPKVGGLHHYYSRLAA